MSNGVTRIGAQKQRRPWEITFLGCGFVAIGVASGIVHAWHAPINRWLLLIELVEVWAIIGGVFLILGKNWARWALIVWMAFHIMVGALHSVSMGLSHGVLAAAITYFLLRGHGSNFFEPRPG
jgi:hypothetical protein